MCDTAGLRHSVDPVENEGLRRAREAASTADLVIIVMDVLTGPAKLLQLSTKEMARLECERLNLSFSKSHNKKSTKVLPSLKMFVLHIRC